MRPLTAALAAALFMSALLLPSAVAAQGAPCVERSEARERLAGKFGETPVFRGITATGKMFEVFANLTTGTFTVMLTSPQGMACYVDSGESARIVYEVIEGEQDS